MEVTITLIICLSVVFNIIWILTGGWMTALAFLLAGVTDGGRLSIVTTEPNAAVAPVHNRMPLVLGPGESDVWLFGDFASLADRRGVALSSEPER